MIDVESLAYTHWNYIVGALMRRGASPEDADDIAQSILLYLWRKRHTLKVRDISSLLPVIITTHHNMHIRYEKSRGLSRCEDIDLHHSSLPEPSYEMDDTLALPLLKENIQQTLLKFSSTQRTYFKLFYLRQESLTTHAKRFQINYTTVKRRAHRARDEFITHFNMEMSGDGTWRRYKGGASLRRKLHEAKTRVGQRAA